MPSKAKKMCKQPGCNQLVDGAWCDQHKKITRTYDDHRGSAAARGYDARWRAARARWLCEHPFCVMCEVDGKLVRATVVDHIVPHRGDRALFWDSESNWQSLCKRHHDIKTVMEDGGFGSHYIEKLTDPSLKKINGNLVVVSGPSGSGKSTYVKNNMQPGELLIDLDIIKSRISGQAVHNVDNKYIQPAIAERNRMLKELGNKCNYKTVWLIASAPMMSERQFYVNHLGANKTIVLTVDIDTCISRLMQDSTRINTHDRYIRAAREWWAKYEPWDHDTVIYG